MEVRVSHNHVAKLSRSSGSKNDPIKIARPLDLNSHRLFLVLVFYRLICSQRHTKVHVYLQPDGTVAVTVSLLSVITMCSTIKPH